MKTIPILAVVASACLGSALAQTPLYTEEPVDLVNDYLSLGEWNSAGNAEGWGRNTGAIAPFVVANGTLEVATTGGDPWFFRSGFANALGITPELTVVEVRLRMLAGSGAGWEMFWGSTAAGQGGFSGGRRIDVPLSVTPDDLFHVLHFDFTGVFPDGIALNDFRIDPGQGAGNRFQVDYVRVGRVMPDTDGDGLPDVAETGTGVFVNRRDTGTDPAKADTDGDSVPDGLEVELGTDPNDPADFPVPSIDRYDVNPATYVVNIDIKPNTPTVTPLPTTGPVKSFAIQPALPSGLSLNPTTGVIAGTPTAVRAATDYTVTATFQNDATAQIVLNLEVRNPYIAFDPAFASRILKVNLDLGGGFAPDQFGVAPTTFSISPALPEGLIFDEPTGIIWGTPLSYSPPNTYTVTAQYTGYPNSTADVTLSVLEDPLVTIDPEQTLLSYLSWGEFDDPADLEGWFRNGIDVFTEIVDGALVVRNIGGDPFFGKNGTLATDFRILEIRAKIVEGVETGFRTYWSENAPNRGYSEATAYSFNAVADGEYHVYQVDYHRATQGSFNGLRLDPGNGAGNVMHVDYWRFGSFDPSLVVTRQTDGSLRLRWPSAATGYALQSSLTVTTGWASDGSPVTTEGDQRVVTVQPTGAAKFFRLAKP
ncbi:MAG: putative Ig domain-containing protein [Verrucomicrobiales bacterium]|nr:putative Ig domain-containing protein [Verrucomicrobiales bacterium]